MNSLLSTIWLPSASNILKAILNPAWGSGKKIGDHIDSTNSLTMIYIYVYIYISLCVCACDELLSVLQKQFQTLEFRINTDITG